MYLTCKRPFLSVLPFATGWFDHDQSVTSAPCSGSPVLTEFIQKSAESGPALTVTPISVTFTTCLLSVHSPMLFCASSRNTPFSFPISGLRSRALRTFLLRPPCTLYSLFDCIEERSMGYSDHGLLMPIGMLFSNSFQTSICTVSMFTVSMGILMLPAGERIRPGAVKRISGSFSGNMKVLCHSTPRGLPPSAGKPFLTVSFTLSWGSKAPTTANPLSLGSMV